MSTWFVSLLACAYLSGSARAAPRAPDLLARCAAGEASACLERAASARWEWAQSVLRAEQGHDLPQWHRLDEADTLVRHACALGDLAACVDAGAYREACGAGDAASCARVEPAAPWIVERCAAGDASACKELHGGRPGVEVQVLPLPPSGHAFYLGDGSLVAFDQRGPAVFGEGGWQRGHPTGFELPDLGEPSPVGDGVILSLPEARYLWLGPEGAVSGSARSPDRELCGRSAWSPEGLQPVRLAARPRPASCSQPHEGGVLAVIDFESGEVTELTALTEALQSKIPGMAIARGWVAAANGTKVARARLERVDGRLSLGPVEVAELAGTELAVSDTGTVAVSDRVRLAVWTDTVTALPAASSPRFAGSRLVARAIGKIFVWDLAAGGNWASQGLTLQHDGMVSVAPDGSELVAEAVGRRALVRVRLVPDAPARPRPAPTWWGSVEVPAVPDPSSGPPPPVPPGEQVISGRVVADRRPVAGVEVELVPDRSGLAPVRLRTRWDGTYGASGLADVRWKARAWSKRGCAQGTGELTLGSCQGFEVTIVDERGKPLRDVRVWAHRPFGLLEPLYPSEAGTFRWLDVWESTRHDGRIVAEHPDGRWGFDEREITDRHRFPLTLSSAPRFTARVIDASGAPVPGATVLFGQSVIGVTGPDGSCRSLRFNPGQKLHDVSVRTLGVTQNVHVRHGPVLELQILPPIQVEALPGDRITFFQGTPQSKVHAQHEARDVVEATFPAPGAWTAYRVREGTLFRAEVTVGAETRLAPDWVAVPVRPVRVVDSRGVPLAGRRLEVVVVEDPFETHLDLVTDLRGVVQVPSLQQVGWSFDKVHDRDDVDLVTPEMLPDQITFLDLGERYRQMLALGHGVNAVPSVSGQYEVISVEPGSAWHRMLAPGDLLPETPDDLWARAQKEYPLASVEVDTDGSKSRYAFAWLPGGPRCCDLARGDNCVYGKREPPVDPLELHWASHEPPYLCVLPPEPPAAPSPPRRLARAIEGQWAEVHPALERSAQNAQRAREMHESGMDSRGAVLAASSDPRDRAEIAYGLKEGWRPQIPEPSEPFALEGEPGIGWWVLERGENGPKAAVIPVSQTFAVRWTPRGYQLLERR